MLKIVPSNRFKRDLILLVNRKYNLDLIDEIFGKLTRMEPLEEKHEDYTLTGNDIDFRECHIMPDWLLICRNDEGDMILFFSRTGSHSDF